MKKQLVTLIAAAVAVFVLAGCMPHSTGPTEVGVRTIKWSLTGKTGVEDKIYPSGATYFFAPFVNDWHTFDTRLNNLEMTAAVMKGDRPGRDDLLFKTVDGNDIGLDVIISYRIDPSKAPMILQNAAIDDEMLQDNIVRAIARSKPRDIFGELNTEEFYIADNRTKKSEQAMQILNEILSPYGVIVERVSTRDYRFSEEYQKAIEEKKIADQKAQKLKSETKAAQEEWRKKLEEAKGDVAKLKAEADGEYNRAVVEADAYYEQQKLIAEAIEAEGRADAEGIKKMNEALAGSGGAAMVKLDIAKALQGKKIVLLPIGGGGLDVRSTDVNSLLELYGIQKIIQKDTAPAPPKVTQPAPAPPPPPEPPTPQPVLRQPKGQRR
jgi:regulator of protease activity HflC (stomatin/prohibitin superfamily)